MNVIYLQLTVLITAMMLGKYNLFLVHCLRYFVRKTFFLDELLHKTRIAQCI